MPRGDTEKISKYYNGLKFKQSLHVLSPFGQGVARIRCPGTMS